MISRRGLGEGQRPGSDEVCLVIHESGGEAVTHLLGRPSEAEAIPWSDEWLATRETDYARAGMPRADTVNEAFLLRSDDTLASWRHDGNRWLRDEPTVAAAPEIVQGFDR